MSRQDDLQKLIINHSRRLQKLKEQEALTGLSTDPHILLEIENVEAEIERLLKELQVAERISGQTTTLSAQEEAFSQRNRVRLLEKVEAFWVKRVLEGALFGAARLELRLEPRPEVVKQPWDTLVQDIHSITPPPQGQTIVDLFEAASGKLLILGEPGSGKTITLLELARDLIDRAGRDPVVPIPVVFNLASWTETRKPVAGWLVDELKDKYQIPQKIGQAWVDYKQLLLLLDGLDEVKPDYRTACVEAINAFCQEYDDVKLAVCSRSADYEALPIRLKLDSAVALQRLAPAQVDDYLAGQGESLAELRKLLQTDPILPHLARSPLLLSIMVMAYRGLPAGSVPAFYSAGDWRRHMLETYVNRMFERRGLDTRFTREQTGHWLSWLAAKMSAKTQSLFLIEKIQPDWLPARSYRLYKLGIRLLVGLTAGLIFGLAVGIAAGLVFGSRFGWIAGLTFGLAWGLAAWLAFERALDRRAALVVGGAFGLAWGVAGWLALGSGGAFVFGLAGLLAGGAGFGFGVRAMKDIQSIGTPDKIVIVEILKWSWPKARSSLLLWLVLGLPIGLGIGIPVWLAVDAPAGWAYGLATTLAFVLTFGLAGGLTGGEIETKTVPNQGILRSRRNAVRLGGAFGLIMTLVFGLSFGIIYGPLAGLAGGLAVGLAGWLVGWFIFGGLTYTQHLLVRLLLARSNCAPWDYAGFLDYAAERIFLQKIGGGYIFVHQILLEYFAANPTGNR